MNMCFSNYYNSINRKEMLDKRIAYCNSNGLYKRMSEDVHYNEYVRYNYYDKVVAFNEDLEKIMSAADSNWTNWFYSAEKLATVHPIDFTLHGDNFYGEG